MRLLIIGGTGTISTAVTVRAVQEGWDVCLLNRGQRQVAVPSGVEVVHADIRDEDTVRARFQDRHFDAVADFIGFVPDDVQRSLRLFRDRTDQYVYISSASAYQKPLSDVRIREGTPLSNPFWEYSRNKIACEDLLMEAHRDQGLPVTIVRPSHTYGPRGVPLCYHSPRGSWSVLQRMRDHKPVVVPGDGSSLWTLTWNEDFAVGFVGLLANPHAIGHAVHITSDEVLTWDQIHRIAGNAMGVEPELYHIATDFIAACDPSATGSLGGDKSHSVLFDNTLIRCLVPAFRPVVRFDQGVRRSVAFLLERPDLQIPDSEFDALCDRMIAAQEAARRQVAMEG